MTLRIHKNENHIFGLSQFYLQITGQKLNKRKKKLQEIRLSTLRECVIIPLLK